MRKFLVRAIVSFVAFTIVFPLAYVLLVPEQRGQSFELPLPAEREYSVYVVDWGFHTAIVIEQPESWAIGPPGQESAPFLEYSWGDRSFFLDADYRPHILYAAVVLPTASIVYLSAHRNPPSFAGSRAVFLRKVDATTLRSLATGLERSISHTPVGKRVQPRENVRTFAGVFYPANAKYLWPRDCNWWTVARLEEVGLAKSPFAVIVSGQVAGRLRGFQTLSPPTSLPPVSRGVASVWDAG